MGKEININAITGEITETEHDEPGDDKPLTQTVQYVESQRRSAYQVEADPLYFGWQRGENTEQDWLNKVAEIKARYPYPS